MSSQAVGGAVELITVDKRPFSVTSDADVSMGLGGYSNEVRPNGTPDTARLIKNVKVPSLGSCVLAIDQFNGDQEFLQSKADENTFFPMTIKFASGATYSGSAQIVGDLDFSSQNASCDVTFSGVSRFRRLS